MEGAQIPIIISDSSTWPIEAVNFLEANHSEFFGWECMCCSPENAGRYDALVSEFRNILRNHSLVGYHCTRLTEQEIRNIRSEGMVPQNATSLSGRIDRIVEDQLVGEETALILKSQNQADEPFRKEMIWFCFFEPSLAGEDGIGRLFSSWGGEALYNLHERHPVVGPALQVIGAPCIIKANVPIISLVDSKFPDGSMTRAFLLKLGHTPKIPIEHEGYSTSRIPTENVIEIIEYPTAEFLQLTGCTDWAKYPI